MQVRGDPPQFHHDSHDPCWPAPRSSQAWAAWHFVRPVFHLLTWQVELGSTELVVEWTWQQLRHRSGGYAVSWALYVLINSVCPSNGPARPRPGALRCLIHLFVVSSCIRLRREVQGARPARWAARAIRVLPHQWLSQIYHGSEAQSTLRRILDGVPEFPAVPRFLVMRNQSQQCISFSILVACMWARQICSVGKVVDSNGGCGNIYMHFFILVPVLAAWGATNCCGSA